MKTAVIICEFNPLHTGHKRLIDFARTVADNVICVMSGNFVQRGLPACCNKFKRAVHAVKAGADLVVELPTVFATASAENFALGGVCLANSLNADFLVFGSECGDIDKLQGCADMLCDAQVNEQIRQELSKGVSYPKAVSLALRQNILEKPNNVLAVEYLKALKLTNSKIVPKTILREDNYNGQPQEFASSSALRSNSELRDKFTFPFVREDIDDSIEQKYKSFAVAFLATQEKQELTKIEGIGEGLENRIFDADKTHGYDAFLDELKTKRYTRMKLQRVVLNCVLGITKQAVAQAKQDALQGAICGSVLAVKESKTELLQNVTKECDDITKRADRLYSALDGSPMPKRLLKIK